ncbi:DnaJ domain-containing protein [bacterium]|nr:DnaJ domain-containing protein [bacterium]
MSVEYKDYYKILGVDRSASKEDIKKAYRTLSRKYHPDVNKEAGAEDKFKDVQEAYDVLGDETKRKKYDRLGADWKHGQSFRPEDFEGFNIHFGQGGGGGQRMHFGGSGFSDFFDAIFGGMGGMGGMGGRQAGADPFGGQYSPRGRQGKGRDVEAEYELSIEDLYAGGTHNLQLQSQEGPKNISFTIKPGLKHGSKIKLKGKGLSGPGGVKGDLFLKIALKPHRWFTPDGFDLRVKVPVAPWEAALGGKVEVPTPEGNVRMTLKPGTVSGRKLKLEGKGLPRTGDRHGDLIAEIEVTVPEKLSGKEKELYEKLKNASEFKPREWSK